MQTEQQALKASKLRILVFITTERKAALKVMLTETQIAMMMLMMSSRTEMIMMMHWMMMTMLKGVIS